MGNHLIINFKYLKRDIIKLKNFTNDKTPCTIIITAPTFGFEGKIQFIQYSFKKHLSTTMFQTH